MKKSLEQFFQVIANDPSLTKRFESITDRKEFLKLAVQLGSEHNYIFTASEIETAIDSSTTTGQGEYFCLPLGCWPKAKSA